MAHNLMSFTRSRMFAAGRVIWCSCISFAERSPSSSVFTLLVLEASGEGLRLLYSIILVRLMEGDASSALRPLALGGVSGEVVLCSVA